MGSTNQHTLLPIIILSLITKALSLPNIRLNLNQKEQFLCLGPGESLQITERNLSVQVKLIKNHKKWSSTSGKTMAIHMSAENEAESFNYLFDPMLSLKSKPLPKASRPPSYPTQRNILPYFSSNLAFHLNSHKPKTTKNLNMQEEEPVCLQGHIFITDHASLSL